jgi:hypothetical protein
VVQREGSRDRAGPAAAVEKLVNDASAFIDASQIPKLLLTISALSDHYHVWKVHVGKFQQTRKGACFALGVALIAAMIVLSYWVSSPFDAEEFSDFAVPRAPQGTMP